MRFLVWFELYRQSISLAYSYLEWIVNTFLWKMFVLCWKEVRADYCDGPWLPLSLTMTSWEHEYDAQFLFCIQQHSRRAQCLHVNAEERRPSASRHHWWVFDVSETDSQAAEHPRSSRRPKGSVCVSSKQVSLFTAVILKTDTNNPFIATTTLSLTSMKKDGPSHSISAVLESDSCCYKHLLVMNSTWLILLTFARAWLCWMSAVVWAVLRVRLRHSHAAKSLAWTTMAIRSSEPQHMSRKKVLRNNFRSSRVILWQVTTNPFPWNSATLERSKSCCSEQV